MPIPTTDLFADVQATPNVTDTYGTNQLRRDEVNPVNTDKGVAMGFTQGQNLLQVNNPFTSTGDTFTVWGLYRLRESGDIILSSNRTQVRVRYQPTSNGLSFLTDFNDYDVPNVVTQDTWTAIGMRATPHPDSQYYTSGDLWVGTTKELDPADPLDRRSTSRTGLGVGLDLTNTYCPTGEVARFIVWQTDLSDTEMVDVANELAAYSNSFYTVEGESPGSLGALSNTIPDPATTSGAGGADVSDELIAPVGDTQYLGDITLTSPPAVDYSSGPTADLYQPLGVGDGLGHLELAPMPTVDWRGGEDHGVREPIGATEWSSSLPLSGLPLSAYLGGERQADLIFEQIREDDETPIQTNFEGNQVRVPIDRLTTLDLDLSGFTSASNFNLKMTWGILIDDLTLLEGLEWTAFNDYCTVTVEIVSINYYADLGIATVTFDFNFECTQPPEDVTIGVSPPPRESGYSGPGPGDDQQTGDGGGGSSGPVTMWPGAPVADPDYSGETLVQVKDACIGAGAANVTIRSKMTHVPDSLDYTIDLPPGVNFEGVGPSPFSTVQASYNATDHSVRVVATNPPHHRRGVSTRWYRGFRTEEEVFYPAMFTLELSANTPDGRQVTLSVDESVSYAEKQGDLQPVTTQEMEPLTLAAGLNVRPSNWYVDPDNPERNPDPGPPPTAVFGAAESGGLAVYTTRIDDLDAYEIVLEYDTDWLTPVAVEPETGSVDNWYVQDGALVVEGSGVDPTDPHLFDVRWTARAIEQADIDAEERRREGDPPAIPGQIPVDVLPSLSSATAADGSAIGFSCASGGELDVRPPYEPRGGEGDPFFLDDVTAWPIVVPVTLTAAGFNTERIEPDIINARATSSTNPAIYTVKSYALSGTDYDDSLIVWSGFVIIPQFDPPEDQQYPVEFDVTLYLGPAPGSGGGGGLYVGKGYQVGGFSGIPADVSFGTVIKPGRHFGQRNR